MKIKYKLLIGLIMLFAYWAMQPQGTLVKSNTTAEYADIKCENGVEPYYLSVTVETKFETQEQKFDISWQCGDDDRRYIKFKPYSIEPIGNNWSTLIFKTQLILGLIKINK